MNTDKMNKDVCEVIAQYCPYSFDDVYHAFSKCKSFDVLLKSIEWSSINGASIIMVNTFVGMTYD